MYLKHMINYIIFMKEEFQLCTKINQLLPMVPSYKKENFIHSYYKKYNTFRVD